jgi:hypothetical protein
MSLKDGVIDNRPAPDPEKLLAFWLEWERGQTPPGRVLANLKTAGMRDLLESTVAAHREIGLG